MLFSKPYYKVESLLNPIKHTVLKQTDSKVISLMEAVEVESITAEAMLLEDNKGKHKVLVYAKGNELVLEKTEI